MCVCVNIIITNTVYVSIDVVKSIELLFTKNMFLLSICFFYTGTTPSHSYCPQYTCHYAMDSPIYRLLRSFLLDQLAQGVKSLRDNCDLIFRKLTKFSYFDILINTNFKYCKYCGFLVATPDTYTV